MNFNEIKNKIIDSEFKSLNKMQREAVYQVNGPLLILAGAGSGKTTVLIDRIANIITYGDARNIDFPNRELSDIEISLLMAAEKDGIGSLDEDERDFVKRILCHNPANPWQVLAITFTNKAAGEIKDRLEQKLGQDALDIWAGTFHSACARILRREIGNIGYNTNFTIYDMDDATRVVKDCLRDLQISDKQFAPKQIVNMISSFKDKLIKPKQALESVGDDYKLQIAAKVYARYQERLKAANALDFDDMIGLTVELFEKNPDVLDHYQNRFRYIMVDEYQDTNVAQYRLISLLSKKYGNLCVVGDDDQSIYKFRGATIENILGFENDFPNAKIIRLEQNYRSTQMILDTANAVIKNNVNRKGKNLWTDNGQGNKIYLSITSDEMTEAQFIRQKIIDNVAAGGHKFSDHAILYRMNAQSNSIERDFARSALPYRIIGGHKFYDRKEIKDAMAYLSVINNPNDTIRLKRIINEPKRGIGDATIVAAEQISEGLGIPLFDVISNAEDYPLLGKKEKALREFSNIILELASKSESMPLIELYNQMLDLTGYTKYLQSKGDEGATRLENIAELGTNILQFSNENPDSGLTGFLEEVSLITDIDNFDQNADAVTLMTVHSAKGLEFPYVFILGMEESIFPGMRASSNDEEIEEERRLAYVAITRAKEELFITNAKSRMLFGKTVRNRQSRFIDEIPNALKQVDDRTISSGAELANSKNQQKKDKPTLSGWKSTPKVEPVLLDFGVGDRVEHKIFGIGNVVEAKTLGNDMLLEIEFEKAGHKRIMAKFAKLTKVN